MDIIPVTREQLTDALTSAQLVFEITGRGRGRRGLAAGRPLSRRGRPGDSRATLAQFRDKLRQPPVPLPMPDDAPEPDAELAALDVILDVLASSDDLSRHRTGTRLHRPPVRTPRCPASGPPTPR